MLVSLRDFIVSFIPFYRKKNTQPTSEEEVSLGSLKLEKEANDKQVCTEKDVKSEIGEEHKENTHSNLSYCSDDDEFFDAEEPPKEYIELEEKAKAEFSAYIKDSIINNILIYRSYRNNNSSLHARITLQDKGTAIKVSELL